MLHSKIAMKKPKVIYLDVTQDISAIIANIQWYCLICTYQKEKLRTSF